MPKLFTPRQNADALALYNSGLSAEQAARQMSMSPQKVLNMAQAAGTVRTGACARRHHFNEDFFKVIQRPEQAYWLGFLAADGNVFKRTVEIKLKMEDRAHLCHFMRATAHPGSPADGFNNFGRPCSRARLNSRVMVEHLAIHGIRPNKTWTVMPADIPLPLEHHYWRGVFDGDGWITEDRYTSGSVRFMIGVCGNEHIVGGFRDFMTYRTGLRPAVIVRNRLCQISYGGQDAPREVASVLYSGHTTETSLERKWLLAESLLIRDI